MGGDQVQQVNQTKHLGILHDTIKHPLQYNLNGSNPGWLVYHGWFELFSQSLQNPSNIGRAKRKFIYLLQF